MRKTLRSSLLAASALLISFGLSSCGSGNPTPFAGSTTSFAYLQESSVSATKVPAVAGRAHELNPRRARVHEARPRISNMGTGINLGAGNIDLYVMDSATGARKKSYLLFALTSTLTRAHGSRSPGAKDADARFENEG